MNNKLVIVIFSIVTAALVVAVIFLLLRPVKTITNFEECKQAGGTVLEMYPELCKIGNATFTNESQSVIDTTYVGMTEQDALASAAENNIPARVVERDGQGLPTDMSYTAGRHNFYVRDGVVYKVDVE